jgi:hypothetical protein
MSAARTSVLQMTSAAATLPAVESARMLPKRVASLLEFLAVGGAGVLLFPVLWLLRLVVGLDSAELGVGFLMFHAAHVINDPHFAVTYLLFYKGIKRRLLGDTVRGAQRLRYLLVGCVLPLALGAVIYLALAHNSARALGALIELMFLLVGWHYVKQGFGVLSVLSARRGVAYSTLERRTILAHCYAGWAYAWASPASAGIEAEEKGVVYQSLPHPALLERGAKLIFVLSACWLLRVLYLKFRRERRTPPLAALTGLLVSVWLWSVYSSIDPLMLYVVPALHSLQYLYVVWLLTRNQARAAELPPFFGPRAWQRVSFLAATSVALGWFLLHGFPELLDGARLSFHRHAHERLGDLGATPYFAAFFAFVNIHHYAMDSVIWRRENKDTRHLLAP